MDVNVKTENKEYVFSFWDESFQTGLFQVNWELLKM